MLKNTQAIICFILFSENTEALICFILFFTNFPIVCFILFSHQFYDRPYGSYMT